jgi:pimeloyl-ACP methyl ester carboxylesterase
MTSFMSVTSTRTAMVSNIEPKNIEHKSQEVSGLNIFYREAGNRTAPHVVLLHGFPTSSYQYRHLIPLLSDKYHVVAPDLPGFGLTVVPDSAKFEYTFENITNVVGAFLDGLKINEFAVYVFDYGADIACRLAITRPDLKIQAFISQSGNVYEDGLEEEFWADLKKYWKDGSLESRNALKSAFGMEFTRFQYEAGVPQDKLPLIEPEAYYLDDSLLSRPGKEAINLDLFYDIRNNVKLYPEFHEYFRTSKVPILAVWGKNDPIFIPQGAEAFKKDSPSAVVKLYDTGHFALETHVAEIARDIHAFLEGVYSH